MSDHVPTFCPKSLISVGRPGMKNTIQNKSGETDCVRYQNHVILTILHRHTNIDFFAFAAVLRATY